MTTAQHIGNKHVSKVKVKVKVTSGAYERSRDGLLFVCV